MKTLKNNEREFYPRKSKRPKKHWRRLEKRELRRMVKEELEDFRNDEQLFS